jgi:hypothetical protein
MRMPQRPKFTENRLENMRDDAVTMRCPAAAVRLPIPVLGMGDDEGGITTQTSGSADAA